MKQKSSDWDLTKYHKFSFPNEISSYLSEVMIDRIIKSEKLKKKNQFRVKCLHKYEKYQKKVRIDKRHS